MNSLNTPLSISFFLLIGIPCLLAPRQVQILVIRFNERFGHREGSDSFRRSEEYLGRLRFIGWFCVLVATVIALLRAYAEDIVRAVI